MGRRVNHQQKYKKAPKTKMFANHNKVCNSTTRRKAAKPVKDKKIMSFTKIFQRKIQNILLANDE